jgi:histone acetyltransferase (RNA polymerase elongator complex component)
MKKHAIIPVFIPHRGCPHDCVFCNQRKITARTDFVTPEDARKIIDTWLTTLRPADTDPNVAGGERNTVEAAFYGGSFTGLDIEEQSAFLEVTYEYKKKGLIDKVHLSTRPDYIDREILDNLKRYSVDTIELGVQSFDDEVLRLSNRGHSSEDVYRAVSLIQEYGFELGIQLMIGLPGDSAQTCIMSALKTAEIRPSLARLYPTIVLDDTELYNMYKSGAYEPLSREEAVYRTKEMYKILDDAGITIMRVGLKSTEIIGEGGAINGGTYHPAFRQLVEGEIAKERIEPLLRDILIDDAPSSGKKTVTVSSNNLWFSAMIGHKACNRKYFAEKYPDAVIKYSADDSLPDGEFSVCTC